MDLRPVDLRILSLYVHLKVCLPAFTLVWLQEDLDCSVLLLLKHLVGLRRLVQWQGVCGEIFHAERVAVGE
jgi:hypothetical protein